MNYLHDPEHRWSLSLDKQLANIGSEFSRAVKHKGKNEKRFRGAMGRMIDLFRLTTDMHNSITSAQRGEVCRAKEVVCDFLCGDNEYKGDAKGLQKYFDTFIK